MSSLWMIEDIHQIPEPLPYWGGGAEGGYTFHASQKR